MIRIKAVTSFDARRSLYCIFVFQKVVKFNPPGGGVVLRITSDGGDRRIFLRLEFSIPGFFSVGKFGNYFFYVA